MSLVDYLFLQTLFPSTIRPTGLQILRKYLGRVLLHHHSLDRARVSGGATGAVPTAAAVLSALGALDLDRRILRLQFRVARRGRGRAAAVLEPRCGEVAHGLVVKFVVVVDGGVLGVIVGVGIGAAAAGGDALEVVVGGEGAVAGVGGEGGGRERRRVVVGGGQLALMDRGGGGGGGGVRGGRRLGGPGTVRRGEVGGVAVH